MASFSNFFSNGKFRTTFFLCWSLCRLSSSLRCLQSPSFSPLRKAAISPIHNVKSLLYYTLSRPLLPWSCLEESCSKRGRESQRGCSPRFWCCPSTSWQSHSPNAYFFSQNLNQQIQFTSHVNKIVLEPQVLPFDSRRRVATRSVHSVHNDQYRRIATLRYTGTFIFFAYEQKGKQMNWSSF